MKLGLIKQVVYFQDVSPSESANQNLREILVNALMIKIEMRVTLFSLNKDWIKK